MGRRLEEHPLKERFVSEPIIPVPGSIETGSMPAGEPGLPRKFHWRNREIEIAEILAKWKESGSCSHGSSERYLRKHWFHVRTADGSEWKLYFRRQQGRHSSTRARWFLYSILTGKAFPE